jgi:ABC-2 type transport system permease protein
MNATVRSELVKLRTSRASLGLLGAGLVYAAFNGVATAAFAGRDGNAPLGSPSNIGNILRGGSVATWVVLLASLLSITGEHRHRTITTTYLATPHRGAVVRAKMNVYGMVGVGYALASMAVSLAAAMPRMVASSTSVDLADGHVVRMAFGLVVTTVLYGLAGIGIGALVPNQTAAAVGTLAWLVAAENIVGSVVGWRVARWFPGQAAAAASGAGRDILLPMAPGAALFAAYVLAAALIGARVALGRDVI